MSRADRAYLELVVVALASAAVLAVPLAITLFPGGLQRLLHGPAELARLCAGALYALGTQLPPLGAVVLALTLASVGLAARRIVDALSRTDRVLSAHRRMALPARLRRAARRVGVTDRVLCVRSDVAFAYCAGLVAPRIWVSNAAVRRLARDELEAVLWHEAAHLRRRDPLRILSARALATALFAVPTVRWLARRFETAAELDADRVALARRSVAALAGALAMLGRAEPRFAPERLAVGAWSLSHARVDQLCGGDPDGLLPRVPRRAIAATATSLGLALLLALGQAARANLLPAAALDLFSSSRAALHLCPLPIEGILL